MIANMSKYYKYIVIVAIFMFVVLLGLIYSIRSKRKNTTNKQSNLFEMNIDEYFI